MANRWVWDGLEELKRDLRNMPSELSGDASEIVVSAAQEAAGEIRAEYESHRRTGNLANHVKVEVIQGGQFGAGAIVKSTAKHAHIFENGTQARHSAIGANRGAMPPGHVFIPIVVRKRREMYSELRSLLTDKGLAVSGEP